MRVALAVAIGGLVLTTGPATPPVACRDIKNGHVCNATPGCTWPEFKRPAPAFERCWPTKKLARRDIYYKHPEQ
jgi:hypothetical protein